MATIPIGPVAHRRTMGLAVAWTAGDAEVPTDGASDTVTVAPEVGLGTGAPEEQPGTTSARANNAATLRSLRLMHAPSQRRRRRLVVGGEGLEPPTSSV